MSEVAPEVPSGDSPNASAIDPGAASPATSVPDALPVDSAAVDGEEVAPVADGNEPDARGDADPTPEASESPKPSRPAPPPRKPVMLVEPAGAVRGSVIEMSRTLSHVSVSPFFSVDLGEAFMRAHRIKALLMSVSEGAEPMAFLARLRRGGCPCDADIPVVVMASTCDAKLAGQLQEYGVSRLLIEPFKLGDMAHTLEQLWEIRVEIPPQKPVPAHQAEAKTDGETPEDSVPESGAEMPGEEKGKETPAQPAEETQPATA